MSSTRCSLIRPVIYNACGELITVGGLWEALDLPAVVPQSPIAPLMVSIVGGGGKTSIMYRLAGELTAAGKRVIITTTTHIGRPRDYQVLLMEDRLDVSLADCEYPLVVGSRLVGEDKLKGITPDQAAALAAYADVILIEADGAKQQPLKVPDTHEPVLAAQSNAVIVCAGLDALYLPIETVCFRVDQVCRFLDKQPTELVLPADMAAILTSPQGGCKGVGTIPVRFVLNKADHESKIKEGAVIAARIAPRHCVITSFYQAINPI